MLLAPAFNFLRPGFQVTARDEARPDCVPQIVEDIFLSTANTNPRLSALFRAEQVLDKHVSLNADYLLRNPDRIPYVTSSHDVDVGCWPRRVRICSAFRS